MTTGLLSPQAQAATYAMPQPYAVYPDGQFAMGATQVFYPKILESKNF